MSGNTIKQGALWMTLATGLSKTSSLIAQLVLGWMLAKEDFGLFALSLSLASIMLAIKNGGCQQVLIQRGYEYDQLATSVLYFAFVFNLVSAVIVLLIGFVAADIYNESRLVYILLLMGLSILVTTPSVLLRSKISIDSRFKELSFVSVYVGLSRNLLAILLGLLGVGVFSLVLPMLLEPILTVLALYWFIREWPKRKPVNKKNLLEIFQHSKWVMISSVAIALSSNGQYFVVSLYEDRVTLGEYFFAMQLVASFVVVLSSVVDQVLFPGLSKLQFDKDKYALLCKRAIRTGFATGVIFCLGLYVIVGPAINIFWQGKWNESIYVAEILVLYIPWFFSSQTGYAVMASSGRWKSRCHMLLLGAFVDLLLVGLGAKYGDISTVALCLVAGRIVWCIIITYFIYLQLNESLNSFIFFIFKMFCPIIVFITVQFSLVVNGKEVGNVLGVLGYLSILIYYFYLVRNEVPMRYRFWYI